MKPPLIPTICAALIVLSTLSSQTLAQQKTIKACQDDWRANRAENQGKGITEATYVAKCRTGGAGAQPTAPEPEQSPKTIPTTTAPTVTPAPTIRPAPSAVITPAGTNQFATEPLAKARCPSDTVVWVNLSSHIYHFAGGKDYGKTKNGAFMCEKDTAAASFRAAKNEKRPS